MAFTLTRQHVLSIFEDTGKGNWDSFMEAIDPNVHWWISSDVEDPLSKSGIYVHPPSFSETSDQLTDLSRTCNNGKTKSAQI
jgi:hypothetical protein